MAASTEDLAEALNFARGFMQSVKKGTQVDMARNRAGYRAAKFIGITDKEKHFVAHSVKQKLTDEGVTPGCEHLKPCPFCGGTPRINDYTEIEGYAIIRCDECRIGTYPDPATKSIGRWNARA